MWEKLKADKGFDCDFLDWVRDRRELAGMMHYDDVGVGEVVNLGIELYVQIGALTFRFRVGMLATLPPEDPWSKNETWEKGIEAQMWDWLEEMWAERGDWLERRCGPTLRRSLEPFRQNLSGLVRDTAIGLIDAVEADQQLALLQNQLKSQEQQQANPPNALLSPELRRSFQSAPAALPTPDPSPDQTNKTEPIGERQAPGESAALEIPPHAEASRKTSAPGAPAEASECPDPQRQSTQASDGRWAREIDQLIAEISQLPIVLWLATALIHHVPSECEPYIAVESSLDPAFVKYFGQFANAELEREQHVADCRSFAKRAGTLAGASDPETADAYWFDCLFRHSPRFKRMLPEGGWLYDFPAATIELLQRLKRAGAVSRLTVATPPKKSDQEQNEAETFDLNKPRVTPHTYQEYPLLLYRHATGETRAAHDAAERQKMLSEGWSEDPYPTGPLASLEPSPARDASAPGGSPAEHAGGGGAATGSRRPGRRPSSNLHPEVDQYLDEVSEYAREHPDEYAKKRITIQNFCRSGFDDDTVFGWWRRGDSRCTEAHAKTFEGILRLKPQQFLEKLSKVKQPDK
jgi:hypothetical protein